MEELMQPIRNNFSNDCLSYTFKPITGEIITSLLSGFKSKYATYYSELNSGHYDPEGMANLFTNVINSMKPLVAGVYAIKYSMEDLKYKIKHKDREEYMDYDIFIHMFKDLTNIDLKRSKDKKYIEGIADQNNFLLKSKLQFEGPRTNLYSHFLNLYRNKQYCNVVFELRDGSLLKAHKAVLAQCPYFDRMFQEEWKESGTTTPIKLDVEPELLYCLVLYLYTHNLEQSIPAEKVCIPFYLDLLTIADFVLYDNIKFDLINRIHKAIDKNNFIHLVTKEDPNLEILFLRRLLKYSDDPEINLSEYSLAPIVMLCLKAKKSEILGTVYQCALKEIPKKLELNQEFIYICKEITRYEDGDAKEVLVKALTENKELYRKLKKGRKEEYKEHWELYRNMLL